MCVERHAPRLAVTAAVVAIVLLAAACSGITGRTSAPTTTPGATTSTATSSTTGATSIAATPPSPTAWDAVTAHIGADGQLDLAGTRLAFALLFHPLPGVQLPPGATTTDERSNGTLVARSVLNHWNELSVADRTIMAPYFDASDASSTAAPSTSPPTTASGHGKSWSAAAPPSAETAQLTWVSDQVWTIAQKEADKFEFFGTSQAFFEVRFAKDESIGKDGKKDGADAWTDVVGDKYKLDPHNLIASTTQQPAKCIIFLPPHVWTTLPSSGSPSTSLTEQLAHEVFHCYQGDIIGRHSLTLYEKSPSWLIEGGAAWAGADYAGSNQGYDDWYQGWLENPTKSLFKRSYDAIGFYSIMQRIGALSWPIWRKVFEAMRGEPSNADDFIYQQLTENVDTIGPAWAPAYSRHADWSPDWDQAGYDVGSFKPSVTQQAVHDGTHLTLEGDAYAAGLEDLTASSPVIVTVTAIQSGDHHGVIRVHDADTYDEIANPIATFCMGGSCACVTAAGSDAPVGVDVTGTVRVAVTGLDTGQAVRISAKANDKHCELSKPPGGTAGDPNSPGGPTCAGNCGASNGDPHLTTINGYHYDMQGAGEFVMLRSPSGFEVQTRDVPPATGPKPISFNTAIAMRVDGQRITVGLDDGPDQPPVIRRNGNIVSGATTRAGEVTIAEDTLDTVTVTAPGQPRVVVRVLPRWGLHLLVDVPTALVSAMKGLLAPVQADRLAARDGHLVALTSGSSASAVRALDDRLYHDLAESWRVTQSESLFDYASGQSTATFTDRSVPDLSATPVSASQLAAGRTTCSNVSPTWLRDECAYDVAATGDDSIAGGYAALVPPTSTSPGKAVAGVLHPGDAVPPTPLFGKRTYHLVITKPGFLDITPSVGCFALPTARTLILRPDGSKAEDAPDLCDETQGLNVTVPGTYTLVFDSGGQHVAHFGFTISAVRPKQFP
jgi:hypothetical protein